MSNEYRENWTLRASKWTKKKNKKITLMVRTPKTQRIQGSNVVKKNQDLSLGVRTPEIQRNQRSNAKKKLGKKF